MRMYFGERGAALECGATNSGDAFRNGDAFHLRKETGFQRTTVLGKEHPVLETVGRMVGIHHQFLQIKTAGKGRILNVRQTLRYGITFIPLGKSTSPSSSQPQKTPFPITRESFWGSLTLARFLHPAKAQVPILITLSGISTSMMLSQSSNAAFSMHSIPSGIVICPEAFFAQDTRDLPRMVNRVSILVSYYYYSDDYVF